MRSDQRVGIGEVASIIRGVTYDKADARTQALQGYVPLLRATNIGSGTLVLDGFVFVPESVVRDDQRLRAGDILLSASSGSLSAVGKAALLRSQFTGTFGAFCYVVRPDETFAVPEYLAHFMQTSTYRGAISQLAAGVNINNLRREHVASITLPLCSPTEQQRIVEALDSYLSRLDAAVASLERVRAKLKAYRASVLKAAVEGRLVPTEAELARREGRAYEPAEALLARVLAERRRRWEEAELAKLTAAGKKPKDGRWRAKYREPVGSNSSKLTALSEGWCWATVNQLSTLVTDGDHNPPRRVRAGVPHLTAKHIKRWQILLEDCSYVSPEGFEKTRARYEPQEGDVVVTCVGTVGETAVVPPATTFSADRNLAAIRLIANGVLPKFMMYLLSSPDVRDRVRSASGATAQPHLYLGDLRMLHLPIPPRAEQDRIVEEIERLDSIGLESAQLVDAQLMRSRRLRQAILKWAFEGKLVEQDPADEPAEDLLARIRAGRAASGSTKKARGRAKGVVA
jgi:type I restriction enzyme S subunit